MCVVVLFCFFCFFFLFKDLELLYLVFLCLNRGINRATIYRGLEGPKIKACIKMTSHSQLDTFNESPYWLAILL